MAERVIENLPWRTSSRSGNDQMCVEMAVLPGADGLAAVSDSKLKGNREFLPLAAEDLSALLNSVRRG